MAITLTPEQEKTLRQDASALGYQSPESYLADNLQSIHELQERLANNADEFTRLIDEGFDAIDRGELLSAEEAKAYVAARKQEFMTKRSAA